MTNSLLPLVMAADEFRWALLARIGHDFDLYVSVDAAMDKAEIAASNQAIDEFLREKPGTTSERESDRSCAGISSTLIHLGEVYARAAKVVLTEADFNSIIRPERHSVDYQRAFEAQSAPVLALAFAP